MEGISLETHRKSAPSLLYDRLDLSVNCAEGFFIRKGVAQNEFERRALAQIMRREPECFQELVEGSGVFRITQAYLAKRRNLILLKNYQDSMIEPLRRALWFVFIIEHNIHIKFSDSVQNVGGISFVVDDFISGYSGFDGLVISVPQRKNVAAKAYISLYLKGKIVRDCLDKYLSSCPDIGVPKSSEDLIKSNFLSDGIWPESEDDCHLDPREYPGWKTPVSGKTKWNSDLEILKTGRVEQGYIFGVHPI